MRASPLIAIVDDDESVCRALKRLLASAAMDTEAFISAEEFLAGGTREPDCLVLDVQMPQMNGLALQTELTRLGRQIPIIFITAFDDKLSINLALRSGALAVLQKPLDAQLLLDTIEAALVRRAHLNGGVK